MRICVRLPTDAYRGRQATEGSGVFLTTDDGNIGDNVTQALEDGWRTWTGFGLALAIAVGVALAVMVVVSIALSLIGRRGRWAAELHARTRWPFRTTLLVIALLIASGQTAISMAKDSVVDGTGTKKVAIGAAMALALRVGLKYAVGGPLGLVLTLAASASMLSYFFKNQKDIINKVGAYRALITETRASYDKLLWLGISIYEYAPTMMHSKVLVADGTLSMFGSANFDNRSLELNEELNIAVTSRELAARFLADFEEDLKVSNQLQLDTWRRRSMLDKARERFWSGFAEIF